MRMFLLTPIVAGLFAFPAAAQDSTELLNRMKAMEERIKALESEVRTLKAGQPAASAAVVPAPPAAPEPVPPPAQVAEQTPAPSLGGAAGGASKVFNPDISMIGDFLGAAGNSGNRYTPSL
jgi:hypothetical protein